MTATVDRPVLPPSDPAERLELDELATLLSRVGMCPGKHPQAGRDGAS